MISSLSLSLLCEGSEVLPCIAQCVQPYLMAKQEYKGFVVDSGRL